MAGRSLTTPVFSLEPMIGGGGELALGQAVDAVVFDDVDHRQIAAQQVNELAHADGGRVAVAGDAQHRHGVVGQNGAGGDRRHAPVHAVEAVRAAHEVGRALRRAADAAHLHHALRLDAHLEHGVDDALGDGVVAAAGAERRLAAAILKDRKADVVDFGAGALVLRLPFRGPPWLRILR